MKSLGLVPNKVIRTTLLKVYVRGGLFEKSRELLLELEALGYAEDEMPYCLLMDGLAKAGNINEARSIFDETKEKGVKSDGYSHSIMISAYCRGGFFEEAKQLAKDFEAEYDKYDLVMLNTLLCAYCRADDMESVMQTMMKMDELRISPSYTTFHILIKYFCKQKLYLLAYRTMEDMHRKGHQPQEDNTELISQAAIKKFANAFMKLGNINMINDVMKVIHGSGYKIDQELFQMAISRYIENPEKKDLLLQLLQWMPGQGYAVDSSTRNLILKNSHLFGRQLIAEILSRQQMMSKALKSH
ncbi:pentatricopeptide repeat-containing protein At1g10910, chloroplastic [Hevea brasiliensis]|uniref:pentatricopeptide repeat-containing protein At1g10910, chloroplastic n=1 Tax=Hevea brasiliensis TaxID=3981 RepID=UPI0025E666B5|nr:pentatricopeptide repeat-containing protein At1g10910, chloroplastic [Hevea brasiliensis]XP_058007046.1 pentatricopeptide repeat-containing protein At1g10910, chloroplastic [Hevea brasiliensis]